MSSTLQRIESIGQAVAKDYSPVRLVPRGTPRFHDQNLRGTVRFARRQGNFLPVLSPQNSSRLAAAVVPPTDQIQLSRVTDGFVQLGAVLSLGPGRELVRIQDIDPQTGRVTLDADALGSHAADSTVYLYGVPIASIGAHPAGSTTIQIRSAYPVVTGDRIAIDTTAGLLSSTVSTPVDSVLYLGTTIDNLTNYQIELADPTSRALANEEELLLRAQPAYRSLASRIDATGPFCLDYLSGPFLDQTTVTEYLSIQLFTALGDPLTGFTIPALQAKNTAVSAMPIRAESMLFWDVVAGQVQFRDGRFTAVTDRSGHLTVSTELVPPFQPGVEWEVPVLADDTCLMRVRFVPNDFRDFSLGSGLLQRARVGTVPTDQQASRIEIAIRSERAGATIRFNDWLTLMSSASTLQYRLTSDAFGDQVWQAGSLMLKPYWFTLDDIRARYDFNAYNQGVVSL
jgi:hypothetical protein